jgi:hypothetical protein
MTTLPDAKGLTAIEAWILTCIALVLAALGGICTNPILEPKQTI